MNATKRIGEVVARRIDRRRFMNRSAMTIFGAAAAFAVEGIRTRGVLAQTCQTTSSYCSCNPPNGRYCVNMSPSYCSGASCAGGCTWNYTFYSSTACWCTTTCCFFGYYGHYVCCDCTCAGTACGCSAWVLQGSGCSRSLPVGRPSEAPAGLQPAQPAPVRR